MSDEESVGKVSLDLEINEGDTGKQVGRIGTGLAGQMARAMRSSMAGAMRSIKGMRLPQFKAPKVEAAEPTVDTSAVKGQVTQLTAVLDNVNAKIDIQQRKLAELKESYDTTFNDKKKSKILGQIVNTESALLRLTQQSDKTSAKIWQLEDSLNDVGGAAQTAEKPLKQVTKSLKTADQASGNTAKRMGLLGGSFAAVGSRATQMGASTVAAFNRMLRQVFVFAIMYKAIAGLSSYIGGSLRTNEQFMASLNAIRTNLAVAFQPIYNAILPALNALMSWLARATAYIAAFISAIFGTTYKQSYAAAKGMETARKAMDNYGKGAKKAGKDAKKAAKDAKGALASFDELNTLDFSKSDTGADDAGGGAGGGGADPGFSMKMPDMDIDGIQTQMDALVASIKSSFASAWQAIKSGWDVLVRTFGPSFAQAWSEIQPVLLRWKDFFGQVFNDIISLGAPLKNWAINDLVPLWQKAIELMGHILAGLLDTVLMIFQSIWAAVFPIIQKFVTEGLPVLTDFVSRAYDILWKLFDLVKQIFDDIWKGVVDPVMKLLSKIILDTLDIIIGWWKKWGTKIMDGLKETVDRLKELWTSLWEKFLKPITQSALKFLNDLWDKHLKGLVKEILDFVGKLATAALDILNKFVLPIVNWLVKTLGPAFAEIFDGVLQVIGSALGGIIDAAKGIIKALGGIIDFIAGVFTGDWKRAWEGIKTVFSGIADALVGIFKGAINMILDAFNFMIRQVNKVSFKVPDWVPGDMGGQSFGISIPQIPKLAKGGLAYGPTLAMVGDNRGASVDPEVVSPLSKLQDLIGGNNQPMIEILSLILDAIKNGDKQTVLSINGTEIGRVVVDAINDITRRTGKSPLIT